MLFAVLKILCSLLPFLLFYSVNEDFFMAVRLTPLSYSFVCSLQGFPYGYYEAYIKYPIFITFNFKLGTTSTAYKNFILLLLSPSHFKLLVLWFLFFCCVSSNKLLQLWLFLIHLFFNIQTRAVNYIQPLQY